MDAPFDEDISTPHEKALGKSATATTIVNVYVDDDMERKWTCSVYFLFVI